MGSFPNPVVRRELPSQHWPRWRSALTHSSAPSPPQASLPQIPLRQAPHLRPLAPPRLLPKEGSVLLGGSAPLPSAHPLLGPRPIPSFLLQDPRVQEKEMPPPLTRARQPSRPSSPLTWDPQEVLTECQDTQRGREFWKRAVKEFPTPSCGPAHREMGSPGRGQE